MTPGSLSPSTVDGSRPVQRDAQRRIARAQQPRQLDAVHVRHREVNKRDVERSLRRRQEVERLVPTLGGDDVMARQP